MSVLTAGASPRGVQQYQLDWGLGRLTPAERAAQGKEARAVVPRGPGLPHTKAELPEDIEQGKIVPERIADTDPRLSGP